MFSGRPSVPPSVRPSVIHMVVLCFRDISSICWQIFAKLLSLVHLGTQMTWLRFWVERSKVKVTPSRQRRTALDGHSTRRYRRVQLFLVQLQLQLTNLLLSVNREFSYSEVKLLIHEFTDHWFIHRVWLQRTWVVLEWLWAVRRVCSIISQWHLVSCAMWLWYIL